MNSRVLSIVTGLSMLLAIPACKKGDEDPFLSLRSRKARVEGSWNYDIYTLSTVTTYREIYGVTPVTTVETRLEEIGGENAESDEIKVTTTTDDPQAPLFGGSTIRTVTGTGTVSRYTVNFTKSNRFEIVKTYTLKSTYSEVIDTTSNAYETKSYVKTENITVKSEGTWNFMDKIKDEFKNKERISLDLKKITTTVDNVVDTTRTVENKTLPVPTKQTYTSKSTDSRTNIDTYAGGENIQAWKLVRLSGDEMIVEREVGDANSFSVVLTGVDENGNPLSGSLNTAETVTGLESFTLHLKGNAEEIAAE